MKKVIIICGPTASGKTSLAIRLAKKLQTEIISADSRQLFKEMNIGTAKPSQQELESVPHHFINSHSIQEHYSAGKFEQDALQTINNLLISKKSAVVVGGSGLYIQAITKGFDAIPKVEENHRKFYENQFANKGLDFLLKELEEKDPVYFQQVAKDNPQRVLRALEVIAQSGKPFSSFLKNNLQPRNFLYESFAIDWPRDVLYQRINIRVDDMLKEGLEQEAKTLYPFKQCNALQTVGYQEFFNYFDGKISKEEAIRLIKRNTRRFAKRQLTWFKKMEGLQWLSPAKLDDWIKKFEL